jgi:hypothetical protein
MSSLAHLPFKELTFGNFVLNKPSMVIIGPERGGQNVCVSGAEMMGDPYENSQEERKKGKNKGREGWKRKGENWISI